MKKIHLATKSLSLSALLTLLFLTSCGSGLSKDIDILVIPTTPTVINADLVIPNQKEDEEEDEQTIIAAPYFKFQIQIANKSKKTLIVNYIVLKISGTDKEGAKVVHTEEITPDSFGDKLTTFHVLKPGEQSSKDDGKIFFFYVQSLPRIPANEEQSQRFNYRIKLEARGYFSDIIDDKANAIINPSNRFSKKLQFGTK